MHPNKTHGDLLNECLDKLREHFDCVSITCSVYESDENTYMYVCHKGHIKAIIGDMQEHLNGLRDMDSGGPSPYEAEYHSEEEND